MTKEQILHLRKWLKGREGKLTETKIMGNCPVKGKTLDFFYTDEKGDPSISKLGLEQYNNDSKSMPSSASINTSTNSFEELLGEEKMKQLRTFAG